MKKLLLPLLVCVFALSFIACDFGRDKAVMRLKMISRVYNEDCPIPAGRKLVIDSSGIEDGYMVFFLRVRDKEPYLLSLIRKNKAKYKEHIRSGLISSANENGIALMKEIKKSRFGMLIRVSSSTTGREINFRYTPEEVADMTDEMMESIFEAKGNKTIKELY